MKIISAVSHLLYYIYIIKHLLLTLKNVFRSFSDEEKETRFFKIYYLFMFNASTAMLTACYCLCNVGIFTLLLRIYKNMYKQLLKLFF